jgi:glycosyltransferase involved in cell wall biosynthesis
MMPKQAEIPLISVILPTWNCADLLRIAIESVLAQSYKNWEIIIINNNSTDHTEEVIKSFNDSRLKLINYANQGIIAAARNKGLASASGDYIAFLDSDDFWYPEKLERCLNILLDTRSNLVCHAERHFKIGTVGPKIEWDVYYGKHQEISFESLLYKGNFLSTSAVLVEASFVNKVEGFSTNRDIITAEDYDLWLKLMKNGARVTIIPEVLGAYRIHDSSASSSLAKHLRAVRQVVRKHHESNQKHLRKNVTWPYFRRLGRITISSCRALLAKGDVKTSIKFAVESFASNN